jgi:hypothetical protein
VTVVDTFYSAGSGIDGRCIWGQGATPVKTFWFDGHLNLPSPLSARSPPTSITHSHVVWLNFSALLTFEPRDLPEGSIIHADKGYTDYHYEDLLEEVGLHLKAQRKKNSKRQLPPWEESLSKPTRQYIETVFGKLSALFSRKIHAVTPRGFELKIVCFLLAVSIQCCRGQLGLLPKTRSWSGLRTPSPS